MLGGTPAQDPLSQVVPGNDDMGGDRDAIVAQIAQLIEHPDPTQKPLWDGSEAREYRLQPERRDGNRQAAGRTRRPAYRR